VPLRADVNLTDFRGILSGLKGRAAAAGKNLLPAAVKRRLRTWLDDRPGVGRARMGDLRRVTPLSDDFGSDRGLPVDRFYIEDFLDRWRADIAGRVLEIGEDTYTRRFGGDRVTSRDVLHVKLGNPAATIVDDLSTATTLPEGTFDCAIVTQTLHLIWDVPAALRNLRRILKPGGVLLATFPGISQVDQGEWGETWYWAFTLKSGERLFAEAFPPGPGDEVRIETHGNVLAASSLLFGLATSELSRDELVHCDVRYPVVLTVRARKARP
jgi:SAM-dependent methyltransferase